MRIDTNKLRTGNYKVEIDLSDFADEIDEWYALNARLRKAPLSDAEAVALDEDVKEFAVQRFKELLERIEDVVEREDAYRMHVLERAGVRREASMDRATFEVKAGRVQHRLDAYMQGSRVKT